MSSLRTEIQTLVLWWIPAALVAVLGTGVTAIYMQSMPERVLNSELTLGDYLWYVTVLNWSVRATIGNLDCLIIAVWQYRVASHPDARSSLIWSLFGLLSGLFSVIAYLGIRIYEIYEQRADP